MLILLIRAIISFTLLLVVIRCMGKRQLGEMQPFELVITLVISELACLPVVDRNIPLSYGVVTILTIFVIHQVIVVLTRNHRMQMLLSGRPLVVYDSSGIDVRALTAMDMQITDLLQSLRAVGHFSLEGISMGIVETSGQLTVIENKATVDNQQRLQVPLIILGQWCNQECHTHDVSKVAVINLLKHHHTKLSDTVILTIDSSNRMVLQSKKRHIIFDNVEGDNILQCPKD